MIDWCDENINGIVYNHGYTFYFLEEEDLMAFKLKWENTEST